MPRLSLLPAINLLLTMILAGCAQTSSFGVVPSPMPTATSLATTTEVSPTRSEPSPFTLSTVAPTASLSYTPTPAQTPTLTVLAKPLSAPLYFISKVKGITPQVWRLERNGARITQITHEEKGVTDLDVASDGRLAYLSNNALIVSDAWGNQRKVLVQGEPLPVWNDQWNYMANTTLIVTDAKGNKRLLSAKDEPLNWNDLLGKKVVDENFIKLTIPVWSSDSRLIAFGMDEAWLANPDSGKLIRVTEQRSDETRTHHLSYVPIGWTPDDQKIILNILPPGTGHGGIGPPWGLGFVNPEQDSIPINPGTPDCCEYSMLNNGKVLLGGSRGLWEIDPGTGHKQILLPEQDPQKPPRYPVMSYPKQSHDNRIYFFAGKLGFVDGKKRPIPYTKPGDATWVNQIDFEWFSEEALWSADAEMLILVGYDDNGRKGVYQISTLGNGVTRLSITGYNLAWGK